MLLRQREIVKLHDDMSENGEDLCVNNREDSVPGSQLCIC